MLQKPLWIEGFSARVARQASVGSGHDDKRQPWRTRFAPAPTGFLHLGHLVNAMHVWGLAHAYGGRVVLRIEDHDRTRCRPEYEAALLDDLDWLGLEPDVYPTASFRRTLAGELHPARQSDRNVHYENALASLGQANLVYACRCTRGGIAQLVSHEPGREPLYPGTCRSAGVTDATGVSQRVILEGATFVFDDLALGRQVQEPWHECGDIVVRDRNNQWTYQLAVVVDDIGHEIDVVIRGEDLLASTGRQLQLASLLGRDRPPQFLHHTLLLHPDGSKLSKANRDTSLRDLRAAGVSAAALLGEAAVRAGLMAKPTSMMSTDMPSLFV